MQRFASTLPLVFAVLAVPAAAHAQQAAADALFDSARAAMAKGNLAAACQQFRASDQLDPAVGTELNLADCEEQRGQLASAWELYRTAQEKLSGSDERFALARSRAQALEPRVPKLTLSLAPGAPKESTVRDGSVELGNSAFGVALPMEPGAHEFVVSAPGFEPRTFQVQLAVGEAQTLSVTPGSSTVAAKRATPTPASQRFATHETAVNGRTSARALGFTLAGIGVAGAGVGAIAGILELAKKHALSNDCRPDKSCTSAGLAAAQSGRTLELVSNIGWVVGAAALGAGAYFLLTSGPSNTPSTSLALATDPTGGQLSLRRSW
jgi:hypothetical protein